MTSLYSRLSGGGLSLCCLALGLLAGGCNGGSPPEPMRGATMGTGYTVKVAALPAGLQAPQIQALIDTELAAVNSAMSSYDPESEISRFNAFRSDEWFAVSPALAAIVVAAQDISATTGGAFDITVGPLVDTWGFGAAGSRDAPPPAAEIDAALAAIGFRKLSVRLEPPALRKAMTGLQVDLSAIAKGYGVDRVAAVLEAAGVDSYLVEIGGELRTRGRRHDGAMWRVGIEQPEPGGRRVQLALPMHRNGAVATSGDYRNFFETDGERYAHIIDPRTGAPVDHELASVTVIADNCAMADGWATALSVLGTSEGYRLAESAGLAALFIERNGASFEERTTPAFAAWLAAGEPGPQENKHDD